LRAIVLGCDPRVQEKLSYGVPYFYHHRRICFIWPASLIPAGYNAKSIGKTKVTLGLCYGNQLSNEQGMLELGNRKQVATIGFSSPAEIKDPLIQEIILEAILVDDEFKKIKKKH
jgi:hypothetical protein